MSKHNNIMRTRAIVGLLLAGMLAVPANVQGCGDKFFVPGRGVRFPNRVVNREAIAVLLYARSGAALNKTITSLSVDARLRTAGYRSVFVASEATLESVLRSAVWDVVVVELADAPDVQSRLPPATATIVLPVVSDAATVTLTSAKSTYPQVLKSPKKDRAFVDAIDKVVAARAKTKTRGV
jgi:hypothetical protein